jgi:hypothetical protein
MVSRGKGAEWEGNSEREPLADAPILPYLWAERRCTRARRRSPSPRNTVARSDGYWILAGAAGG